MIHYTTSLVSITISGEKSLPEHVDYIRYKNDNKYKEKYIDKPTTFSNWFKNRTSIKHKEKPTKKYKMQRIYSKYPLRTICKNRMQNKRQHILIQYLPVQRHDEPVINYTWCHSQYKSFKKIDCNIKSKIIYNTHTSNKTKRTVNDNIFEKLILTFELSEGCVSSNRYY